MKHSLSLAAEARQRTGTGSAKKDKADKGRMDIAVIRRWPRGVTPTLPPSEMSDLHSEVLIPEQFFILAHDSAAHWSGTQRLLFAVLQDAVVCWFRHRHAQNARGRRLFRETHAWFWSKDQNWLFAFERVCAHLKLDPDYIRRGLTRWQTSQPSRQTPSIRVEPVFLPRHLSLVHS